MKRILTAFSFLFFSFLISCNGNTESNPREVVRQTATAVSLDSKNWWDKRQETPGIIIDVRTPEEWKSGYIEGAQFANFFSNDFIQQVNEMQENKNEPIYIYCRSGNRSKQAMILLEEDGYTRIYELSHGILGWVEDGNKTIK